jgi:NAD-dependent deacetylase
VDVDAQQIERLADIVRAARRLLVITGAGISADSGLPTYRGVGGLYEGASTEDGVPIEVALSGDMLRRDAALCWKYVAQIEAACRGAGPNAGHEVIARLQDVVPSVCVLTQNVDGFHRAVGSRDVIEIHGDLHVLSCTRCHHRTRVDDYAGLAIPPACPDCGALVRPGVVLFGEMLPEAELGRLQAVLRAGFDAVLSIGTTSTFPYIAAPVLIAGQRRVASVEINPGESEVSHLVDLRIRGRARAVLEALWERVGP